MMTEDEIIAKALDKSFDGFTCTTSKSMARDILAALTANGMIVVPIEVVQFDCTQYPAMEAKAVEIAGRISGRLGEKSEFPDPVQVLRDAEELFLSGMADHDKYTTVATSKDTTK